MNHLLSNKLNDATQINDLFQNLLFCISDIFLEKYSI